MWASVQRDGRPAEYRWRPLFNAAKFRWRPILECRAVTLQGRETSWNLQGCHKLANRSQPLVGRSSPYYGDMWRRYCCLTSFFPIVDTCLNCEDVARQSSGMVPRWRLFGDFWVLYFQRVARSTFQTCILNLRWGGWSSYRHMCCSFLNVTVKTFFETRCIFSERFTETMRKENLISVNSLWLCERPQIEWWCHSFNRKFINSRLFACAVKI